MFFNFLYLTALLALSPVILYRSLRHGRYRRGRFEKVFGLSKSRGAALRGDAWKTVWVHAVSVGEVNLLLELVKRLESQSGKISIVVSTSTDTGYDLACQYFGADRVFFAPLDFTWAVKRTIRNLKCNQLILAELELWPNLIATAASLRIPVCVVNGRLSERSAAGYLRFSRWLAPAFSRLTAVGCQDTATADRFVRCGADSDKVHVTGSLKFDNAPHSRDTPDVIERSDWAGIDPWLRVWCFGSSQAGEEEIALDVYHRLRPRHPELRLILVPRHPERFDAVADLIQARGDRVLRRSYDNDQCSDTWDNDEVILIDTVGELRHWWGVAQIATVGGSFGDRGGQNMLEPAGYGCATSFGPNTKNFDLIANQLIDADAAVRVQNAEALETFVCRCLTDIPSADTLGRHAQELVRLHRGAYDRTMEMLGGVQTFQSTTPLRRAA
ncbi:3-deoxy-D-manno-octulosonic acid transferase [Neorhodopirellula pilleata]|uniref:3-deoxy-D-manno-octulosonic acid transferase n=1 Tax=Neorhodopirellula pilleata TaxID=2714738 RepID=A0A5C5ZLV8_9BACT|nr:3-deoxy-D-manno-octulosonic acid transferase [Neorhodopirellula pilleata]TWT87821.1 3-deoxy-D-manno-octulosonic acid transferase [Neorhodopirellula pilleata]